MIFNVVLIFKKKDCGLSFFNNDVEKSLKIVGGQEAIPHSWPSIVSVNFYYIFDVLINNIKYTDTILLTCGGTIISRNKILTAAQ